MIKGTKQGVATDTNGIFSLKTTGTPGSIELQVSSVGFTAQIIQCRKTEQIKSAAVEEGVIKMGMADIVLKQTVMGEVFVKAPDCTRKGKIAGAMWVIRRETWVEAITNKIFGKEITVYPNPIAINSVFNIGFNINPGEYAVQFTEVSGKIIASSQVNIVSKNQLQKFNGNMFSGHGVYFVSVSNRQTMKTYTTKLMVRNPFFW